MLFLLPCSHAGKGAVLSRLLRLVLCSFFALAIIGTAHAHAEDPVPDDDSSEETSSDGDTSTDDDKSTDADTADGDSAGAPMTLANYPNARIKRPRVLPHMTLQLDAELNFTRLDLAGSSTSFTVLNFGGAIGLMQGKLEVGMRTGLVLDPDTDLSKVIRMFGAYSFIEKDKYALAGEAALSFDFNEGADTFDGFSLGGRGIYRLNDKMALLGGNDFLTYSAGSENLNANLNIGFLYQFTDEWSAEAHTQLASLGLSGDTNDTTVILADRTPLQVMGYWSQTNKLDAWLGLRFDLNGIGDSQTILVGINYRFGL